MPNTDGYAVLKEIRRVSKIPVIMLTAKSEEYDVLKGYELCADEYIAKPFNLKKVCFSYIAHTSERK